MPDDFQQRGFVYILLILAIVLMGAGVAVYYIGSRQNYSPSYSVSMKQVADNRVTPKPLPSESVFTKPPGKGINLQVSAESDVDITKIPHDGRLFLAWNLSARAVKERINIFTKAPEKSQFVYSLAEDNDLAINIKVNETEYNIKVLSGGSEGHCSQEEFSNQCSYVDEEIQTTSPVKIGLFRIWSRKNNIFLLNPVAIDIDSFDINHLEIYKLKPDTIFQEQEVSMWRDILRTINFEKVT